MRHLTLLALAGAFALGVSSAAMAACFDGHQTASADQATSSTKVTIPGSTKSGG